ncbi:MAG: hypothetical protein WDN49_22765 [Acetobacteraceae bacterium]
MPIAVASPSRATPTLFVSPHRLLPGIMLCIVVTLAATALEKGEAWLFGRAWLEALVLAILLGTAIRTAWTPTAYWRAGGDVLRQDPARGRRGAARRFHQCADHRGDRRRPAGRHCRASWWWRSGSATASAAHWGCRSAWRCWWRAATRSAATPPSPPWRR